MQTVTYAWNCLRLGLNLLAVTRFLPASDEDGCNVQHTFRKVLISKTLAASASRANLLAVTKFWPGAFRLKMGWDGAFEHAFSGGLGCRRYLRLGCVHSSSRCLPLAYAQTTPLAEERADAAERVRQLLSLDWKTLTDMRIGAVKAALQLRPDQEKYWPPVEQAVRDRAAARRQRLEKLGGAAQ